ncbi:MAG: hypothetical protein MJ201_03415 [Mycoplasmoidaceae bacterium]|nr:hypothetical protein [Mycoplasmoidaceae bacterium]
MAQPYKKITKSFFLNNYNIVNVLTEKDDVMKYLETYNSKKQAVMFGTRKKENRDSVPN